MKTCVFVCALVAAAGSAFAQVRTLTFEGTATAGANPTGNGVGIDAPNNYYNGGFSQGGNGPWPNWGIQFVSQSLTIIDSDVPGGSGNFANEPTGDTILFFIGPAGSTAVMNVLPGFDTGFATYYSSIDQPGMIRVWDGLNATGNVLATIPLAPLGSAGNGDPTGAYDTWRLVGQAFMGTAYSVSFEGAPNYIGFDNVTFGSDIPAPGGAALLGMGGLLLSRRRRA